jgi:hypothetical protein
MVKKSEKSVSQFCVSHFATLIMTIFCLLLFPLRFLFRDASKTDSTKHRNKKTKMICQSWIFRNLQIRKDIREKTKFPTLIRWKAFTWQRVQRRWTGKAANCMMGSNCDRQRYNLVYSSFWKGKIAKNVGIDPMGCFIRTWTRGLLGRIEPPLFASPASLVKEIYHMQ